MRTSHGAWTRMLILRIISVLLCVLFCTMLQGCNGGLLSSNNGLKPGINYMQPMKWRMTYRYRIQEIVPSQMLQRKKPSAYDPSIPAVGKGTYEVWMAGPREGEEVRNVKMVYSLPEPTATERAKHTDELLYYYDFAPDGLLPQELQATIQWEFVTFERYTFWDGMEYAPYDKESEIYKRYTKEEWPITMHLDIRSTAEHNIPKNTPEDVVTTALNCYNTVLTRFNYDYKQDEDIGYGGSPGMYDSVRSWDLKLGQCDEFANVYCSLLRSAGIPARPCAGLVHSVIPSENGVDYLITPAAGHAWTEFYIPEYGWIPVDPTFGQYNESELINPLHSYIGATRAMNFPDYYFGREDCLRLTSMKAWNHDLQPPPKTPGAKPSETWFVGYTDRSSGVESYIGGWQGIPPKPSSFGWHRSAKYAWTNFRVEIEALGPADRSEVKDTIKAIEAEGGHYLQVPATRGNWPIFTTGELTDLDQ